VNLLFLGDVMGRAGRKALTDRLPEVRRRLEIDFVIANGENAAGGFGITKKLCHDFYAAGVDAITTGNHVWDQDEIVTYIDSDPRLLRPNNYPPGTPGRGVAGFEELLESCAELGVRFIVCEMGLRAMDMERQGLRGDVPIEAAGIVTFLNDASADGSVVFV